MVVDQIVETKKACLPIEALADFVEAERQYESTGRILPIFASSWEHYEGFLTLPDFIFDRRDESYVNTLDQTMDRVALHISNCSSCNGLYNWFYYSME